MLGTISKVYYTSLGNSHVTATVVCSQRDTVGAATTVGVSGFRTSALTAVFKRHGGDDHFPETVLNYYCCIIYDYCYRFVCFRAPSQRVVGDRIFNLLKKKKKK